MLSDQQVEALVVAVLSVGLWPAERVRAALPRLREVGVLSPTRVAGMELGVLTVKLAKNGYGRGLLTSMCAERLQAVMRETSAGHLHEISNLVLTGNRDNFMTRLQAIHGVGLKVAENAWKALADEQRPLK